jgi:hypothetical protein
VSEAGDTVVRRFPLQKTKAADTTPREAILDILREIDEGLIAPTGVIVMAITEHPHGETITIDDNWWMAGPSCSSTTRTLGWLEYLKARWLQEMLGR